MSSDWAVLPAPGEIHCPQSTPPCDASLMCPALTNQVTTPASSPYPFYIVRRRRKGPAGWEGHRHPPERSSDSHRKPPCVLKKTQRRGFFLSVITDNMSSCL